ncbi:MAG TPA: pyruvate dehydrogenase complex dihydrolipoamide acetyltransferase [Candidatus Acidoferrales bacterium]|nr:pyruvate dehydrogenase complex dihydrolipoamide acetyltransferase [Candidatus Acidoferrales bacterium]
MAVRIQMPKLSDTMDTGRIVRWLKKEGEKVVPGDVIAEVETDKANMDMEAYDEGTLLKIVAKEGDRVPIGGLIAILGNAGEDISASVRETGSVPDAQESERHEAQSSPEKITPLAQVTAPSLSKTESSKGNGRLKASPLAKRLARERGIDIGDVKGSGTGGRIVKRDVEASMTSKRRAVVSSGEFKDESLSMMREAIARRLSQSNIEAPHFFLTVEVKMENAIAFRESLNSFNEESKISFNDIIVKACAAALQEHPEVNATFMKDKIRMFGDVHIGVAVAIDDGLITPVIRDVDKKGLRDISIETKGLAAKARERKLKPEEYSGSTFTVSNLGMFGVDEFTAIINPPEAAILAVGAIVEKPVVEDGQIRIGKRMRMTLSSDHRVVDGALAAQFMQTLKKILESPAALAL